MEYKVSVRAILEGPFLTDSITYSHQQEDLSDSLDEKHSRVQDFIQNFF